MDKRTLKQRAEHRKRQKELVEERQKEEKSKAREVLKVADFLHRFVRDKRHPQYEKLLGQAAIALIRDLIDLKETDPWKNLIETEGLRREIRLLETLISQPSDYFKAEKIINKNIPEIAKEEEEKD